MVMEEKKGKKGKDEHGRFSSGHAALCWGAAASLSMFLTLGAFIALGKCCAVIPPAINILSFRLSVCLFMPLCLCASVFLLPLSVLLSPYFDSLPLWSLCISASLPKLLSLSLSISRLVSHPPLTHLSLSITPAVRAYLTEKLFIAAKHLLERINNVPLHRVDMAEEAALAGDCVAIRLRNELPDVLVALAHVAQDAVCTVGSVVEAGQGGQLLAPAFFPRHDPSVVCLKRRADKCLAAVSEGNKLDTAMSRLNTRQQAQ